MRLEVVHPDEGARRLLLVEEMDHLVGAARGVEVLVLDVLEAVARLLHRAQAVAIDGEHRRRIERGGLVALALEHLGQRLVAGGVEAERREREHVLAGQQRRQAERGVRHLRVGAIEDDARRGERGQRRRGARGQPIGAHRVDGDEKDIDGAEVRAVGQRHGDDGRDASGVRRRGRAAARAQDRRGQHRALEDDGAQRALAGHGVQRRGAGGDGDDADERGVARLEQAHGRRRVASETMAMASSAAAKVMTPRPAWKNGYRRTSTR